MRITEISSVVPRQSIAIEIPTELDGSDFQYKLTISGRDEGSVPETTIGPITTDAITFSGGAADLGAKIANALGMSVAPDIAGSGTSIDPWIVRLPTEYGEYYDLISIEYPGLTFGGATELAAGDSNAGASEVQEFHLADATADLDSMFRITVEDEDSNAELTGLLPKAVIGDAAKTVDVENALNALSNISSESTWKLAIDISDDLKFQDANGIEQILDFDFSIWVEKTDGTKVYTSGQIAHQTANAGVIKNALDSITAVSYTHLTLPTNREV